MKKKLYHYEELRVSVTDIDAEPLQIKYLKERKIRPTGATWRYVRVDKGPWVFSNAVKVTGPRILKDGSDGQESESYLWRYSDFPAWLTELIEGFDHEEEA